MYPLALASGQSALKRQSLDPNLSAFLPHDLISETLDYFGSQTFLCARVCKLFYSAVFKMVDESFSENEPLPRFRWQWHLYRCISLSKQQTSDWQTTRAIIQEYRKALSSPTGSYPTRFKQGCQDCLEIVLPPMFSCLPIPIGNSHQYCIRTIRALMGGCKTHAYAVNRNRLAEFSIGLDVLKQHLENTWFRYFEQFIDDFGDDEDLPAPEIICAFLYTFTRHQYVKSEDVKKCVEWVKKLILEKHLVFAHKVLEKGKVHFISFLLTLDDISNKERCQLDEKYYQGIKKDLVFITKYLICTPGIDTEVQDIAKKIFNKHEKYC